MKHFIIAHFITGNEGQAVGMMRCLDTRESRPMQAGKADDLLRDDGALDAMHQMALAMTVADIRAGRELPEGYMAQVWVDCICTLAVSNLPLPSPENIAFIRQTATVNKPTED